MGRGLPVVNHKNQVARWSQRVTWWRTNRLTASQQTLTQSETVCFAEITIARLTNNKIMETIHVKNLQGELSIRASTNFINNLVDVPTICRMSK